MMNKNINRPMRSMGAKGESMEYDEEPKELFDILLEKRKVDTDDDKLMVSFENIEEGLLKADRIASNCSNVLSASLSIQQILSLIHI